MPWGMRMNPELGDPFRSPPPTKGPRSLALAQLLLKTDALCSPPGNPRPVLPAVPPGPCSPARVSVPGLPPQMSSTGGVPSGVTSGVLQGKAIWEKIFKKQVVFLKKAQLIPTGSWVTWEILQGKIIEVVRKAFSKIKSENKPYRGLEEGIWNSACTGLKARKCLVCLGRKKPV